MAITSYPWDSQGGDRSLTASYIQNMFATIVTDGVRDPAGDFPITITAAASGAVKIGAGVCVINGTFGVGGTSAWSDNLLRGTGGSTGVWGGLIYAYRDTASREIRIAKRNSADGTTEPTCGVNEIPLYRYKYYRASINISADQIESIMDPCKPRNGVSVIDTDTDTTIAGLLRGAGGNVSAAVPNVDYAAITTGEFTPYFSGTGWTYSTRYGKYTQVGNIVTFTVGIQLTSKPSAATALQIAGLPGTPISGANQAVTVAMASGATAELSATVAPVSGAARITLRQGQTDAAATSATIAATTALIISGQYIVEQGV